MGREKLQLLFATKYYFNLCENLINKIDAGEHHLDLNVKTLNSSKRLYQIHLASCCFRLSAVIEKKKGINHKKAYGFLKDKKNKEKIFTFIYHF